MSNWLRRVWHLLNRPRRERELVREMQEHRASMSDPSRFGDTHRLLEQSRDAWGWNWLDDAMQDLAVGTRMLLRSPSFAITAALILSFGIGLNVTLFQMIQTALLRPPAISHPESLVRFHRYFTNGNTTALPVPMIQVVSERSKTLSTVMMEAGTTIAWGRDAAEQIEASFVSTNWFDALGYGAAAGRVLNDRFDASTEEPNAVLGYRFWQTRLGAPAGIVGTTAYIDRKPVTIVGIAAPDMPGLDFDTPDIYLPLMQREYFYPQSPFLRAWTVENTAMYARLRDGVTPPAARDELRSVMKSIAAERSDVKDTEWLEPMLATDNFMRPREKAEILSVVALLAGLTGLVLLVAAANLGNLVMSRAAGRVRELGVRMALGARRSRIVRQLVIEAVPLVVLGTAGSIAFARAVTAIISRVADFPPYLDFSAEWRTVAVASGLGAIALLVVGLLPAWKVAQQRLIDAIKDGGQNVSRALDRVLMRRVMVAAQVAGTCVLLIVAGMMVRSVQRLLTMDLGFDYEQTAVLSMPLGRYGISGDDSRSYWYAVRERVLANPEVVNAAIVTAPPLGGRVFETGFKDTPGLTTLVQSVDPEYFDTMRIPLIAGRAFGAGDAKTAVVSRRLAMEMFGTLDVMGRGFPKSEPRATIVGVAEDAHSIRVNATDVMELYLPLEPKDFSLVYLVARARTDAGRLPPILREAASIDSRVIPVAHVLREDFARRTSGPRLASAIAGSIGAVTLALACLGIFGVVSYGVALRTKEIGIRVALGAKQPALLRAIVRQVLTPVAIGMLLGFALAVPTSRALASEPFYLQNVDPIAFVGALAVFVLAGAIAALWPAFAVLRGNPVDALRHS
jgi:predicted permease